MFDIKFKSKAMLKLEECCRSSSTCGGPKTCKDRKYDPKEKDCQQCNSEALEAIREAVCSK